MTMKEYLIIIRKPYFCIIEYAISIEGWLLFIRALRVI